MGVLHYLGPLQQRSSGLPSPLSVIDDINDNHTNVNNVQQRRVRGRRSKHKDKTYDFRKYGLDLRRKGARHERRKQNFSELLEFVQDDICEGQDSWREDGSSLFAELFMDERKMKVWEGFINLPEDDQEKVLTCVKQSNDSSVENLSGPCLENYLSIDKKIRDLMQSKNLAEDLLEYYEDDVTQCLQDCKMMSVLVMNIESSYHRILVHGLCQYMHLKAITTKICDVNLLEIEMDDANWQPPEQKLTELLKDLK